MSQDFVALSCSIVITCYNKREFVEQAILSCLGQTYGNREVIVVDDGSTDHSLDIIRRYDGQVKIVAKDNGGHVSSANSGFLSSTGDIVIFLDADDFLLEDTLERVCAIWSTTMSKVHFPLAVVDSEGKPLEGRMLPPYRGLPEGNMMTTLRKFGFYPTPPTSGNAFSRVFLNQVMPLDETYPVGFVDTTLIGMSALYGSVGALKTAGGCWRKSDGNQSSGGIDKLLQKLATDAGYISLINKSKGLQNVEGTIPALWPQHLKDQFIVKKVSSGKFKTISLLNCLRDYMWSVWTWPEYYAKNRLMFLIWSIVVYVTPTFIVRRIPGILGPSVNVVDANH